MSTGYVDFPTLSAGAGSTSVPGLGTFGSLAGPVVGSDGTVYLATREGKVIALHDDGQPLWSAQIEGELTISAPPAVGSQVTATIDSQAGRIHEAGDEGLRLAARGYAEDRNGRGLSSRPGKRGKNISLGINCGIANRV